MSDKVLGNRFKGELSRVLLATLGIVLVVMLVGINYFSERFAKERLTRDLKMVGNILANRSASSLHLSDANQAIKNLASARYNRSIDRLCLYGDKGKLFATYLRNGANFLAPCGMTSTISAERSSVTESKDHTESRDKPIGIAVAVEKDGKFIGLLTIVGNLDSLKNDQNRMLSTLIIMFSMVALCAYLLIHLMLARSFKPLGSLYETTKLIAVDHFSGKRAVKFKQDEIGVLVDVFNKMLDSIDASHLKITESEERFRTLAASAPIGIFLMDAQLKRTYVNERWRELTGLDLESSREQYRNCISSKDLGRYLSMYHQLEKDDCKSSIEYQFNRRDSKIHGSTSLMEYIAPIGSNPSKGHLAGYVGSLLDVTDLRQARYELEKLAYYDPLTKLPNRRNFRDYLSFHIEKAVRDNGFLAVLMLDLDNFKRINDTLGHDAGDKVLIILSERLRKRLNPDDLVSRVGGDEFYLVLQEVPTLSVVDQMVKSVMEAASEPIEVGTDVVEVTASIGIARFPLDANSAEELMRNVDIALYRAKSSGKNKVA